MKMLARRTPLKLYLGILCCLSLWASDDPVRARIRNAAAKAIVVIQNSQKTWFSKQSCFSCHQQVLPALAFRAAREHGIPVDEKGAHADAAAALGFYSNLDRAVQFTHIIDPANNDAWGMMAASAAGVRSSLVTAVYARLLAARQEPDGHWETGDDRPPQSYSPVTATAVSVAALEEFGHEKLKADTQARAVRARDWLLAHAPRDTEERVFQIFGVSVAGGDQTVTSKLAHQLAATQQPDGGWVSRAGLSSDAYSTGEALWAMHNAGGIPTSDPAFQRGIEFLLRTQAADGSWRVHSRIRPPAPVSPPYFETGHP